MRIIRHCAVTDYGIALKNAVLFKRNNSVQGFIKETFALKEFEITIYYGLLCLADEDVICTLVETVYQINDTLDEYMFGEVAGRVGGGSQFQCLRNGISCFFRIRDILRLYCRSLVCGQIAIWFKLIERTVFRQITIYCYNSTCFDIVLGSQVRSADTFTTVSANRFSSSRTIRGNIERYVSITGIERFSNLADDTGHIDAAKAYVTINSHTSVRYVIRIL